jgi:hypothetical protein
VKLTRADATTQRFPDGTKSEAVALTFEQDGETVIKRVKISGCAAAVNAGPLKAEATRTVLQAAREAVRDFAYMKHRDDWKQHVSFGSFFSDEMSQEEAELVKRAVELLREQASR